MFTICINDDIATLAQLIMEKTSEKHSYKDPFWEAATEYMLRSVLAYVYEACEKKTENEVVQILSNMSDIGHYEELLSKLDKDSLAVKAYMEVKESSANELVIQAIVSDCLRRITNMTKDLVAN